MSLRVLPSYSVYGQRRSLKYESHRLSTLSNVLCHSFRFVVVIFLTIEFKKIIIKVNFPHCNCNSRSTGVARLTFAFRDRKTFGTSDKSSSWRKIVFGQSFIIIILSNVRSCCHHVESEFCFVDSCFHSLPFLFV